MTPGPHGTPAAPPTPWPPESGPISEPTTTPEPVEPDRYPPILGGRPFAVRPSATSQDVVIGRIGRPERIALPTGERPLEIVGDLVVTTKPVPEGALVGIWSFSTGARALDPILVPNVHDPIGVVAGSLVILHSTRSPEGVVGGVTALSMLDGTLRELVPDTSPVGLPGPQRRVIVTGSGDQIITTVCATSLDFMGDCRPANVIDLQTGREAGLIDLGGGLPIQATPEGVLVGWLDHAELRELDGRVRWATPSYTGTRWLQTARFLDDRTILVGVLVADGSIRRRLLLFDARTGASRVLAVLRPDESITGAEAPDFVLELSTNRFLAVGSDLPRCGTLGFTCEPEGRGVLDLATLDIETGRLSPGAIHLNLDP
jgi:hypothetical protein